MEPSNVLKIESLTNRWCDKDVVILHASFQILKDYVEDEKEIFEVIDWDHSDETKKAKTEILELYNWWSQRCKRDTADKIDDDLDKLQYDEDNLMLKRLITVRRHLWT